MSAFLSQCLSELHWGLGDIGETRFAAPEPGSYSVGWGCQVLFLGLQCQPLRTYASMDSPVNQARQLNFLQLFQEFRQARPELPDRGMLKAFAEKAEMSDRYLSHVRCGRKPIGHSIARRLEQAFAKPDGWMDRVHTPAQPQTADEHEFLSAALALLRASPADAQELLQAFQRNAMTR